MRPPIRLSNRGIIGFGLVLCIIGAVIAAYFLGFLERAGTPP